MEGRTEGRKGSKIGRRKKGRKTFSQGQGSRLLQEVRIDAKSREGRKEMKEGRKENEGRKMKEGRKYQG